MTLYNRQISLQIGDVRMSGLNIEFNVQKFLSSQPNTMDVKIYNLSEATRSRLESFPYSQGVAEKRGTTPVQLIAGYEGQTSSIFVGRLRRVQHYRDQSEIITEVEAGDGEKAQGVRFSRSYKKGTPVLTILTQLAAAMGVGEGNLRQAFASRVSGGIGNVIAGGLSLHGYAVDSLSKLLESRGLDWSVQDQTLQVLGPQQGLRGSAIRLRADTGLVGVPTLDNKGVVTATCLLIPEVNPGRRVQITSEFISGLFTVTQAAYKGSLFGSTFEINLEGKRAD